MSATQRDMDSYGVPAVLLWPAAAFGIGSGVLLTGWCVLTAAMFHAAFTDQNQLINCPKNLAMAGGFPPLARAGTTGLGLDAHRHAGRSTEPR